MLLDFLWIAMLISFILKSLYFKSCKLISLIIFLGIQNTIEYYVSLVVNPNFKFNPIMLKMILETTPSEILSLLFVKSTSMTIKSPLIFLMLWFFESFVAYKVIFRNRNQAIYFSHKPVHE